MQFELGNCLWKNRSSYGRKPKFETASDLWEAASQYFDWVVENPLWENKATQYQGAAIDVPVQKMRAMTIAGMCIYLDISRQNWYEYKAKPEYSDICQQIEDIIYDYKFTGAAADLLNPSIIARDIGLSDKKEITGANGGAIQVSNLTDDQLAAIIANSSSN